MAGGRLLLKGGLQLKTCVFWKGDMLDMNFSDLYFMIQVYLRLKRNSEVGSPVIHRHWLFEIKV